MIYRVRFSYTEEGEGIFQAENEEHLLLGFMDVFSEQLEDLEVLSVEELPDYELSIPTSTEHLN